MNRRILGALAAATLLCVPSWASAQRGNRESGRSGNIEFLLGGYAPQIDSEFDTSGGQQGPYETVFGDDTELMFMLGYERHILHDVGTLSAGIAFGYWSIEGQAEPDPSQQLDIDLPKTTMRIVPLVGQATYRFDMFQDSVPLVPVLRLGVDWYLWDIKDGNGKVAKLGDAEASGATWGWHYAIGVHLLLDYLSPQMAADFDFDAGVNNSYLTFEYRSATVDDFGSDESFRLGDDTFFFGLTLDF